MPVYAKKLMPAVEAAKMGNMFTPEEFAAADEALIQRGYYKGQQIVSIELITIILNAAATARGRENRCARHGVVNCRRC